MINRKKARKSDQEKNDQEKITEEKTTKKIAWPTVVYSLPFATTMHCNGMHQSESDGAAGICLSGWNWENIFNNFLKVLYINHNL